MPPKVGGPLKVTVTFPVLVTVTGVAVWAVLVVSGWLGNTSDTGMATKAEVAATPVPVRLTVSGVLLALEFRVNVPFRVPVAPGVKTT